MPSEHPDFPAEQLRAAAQGNDDANARVDALHRELAAEHPDKTAIHGHVGELRKHASLATIVTNWFEDPKTQAFIDELTGTGL